MSSILRKYPSDLHCAAYAQFACAFHFHPFISGYSTLRCVPSAGLWRCWLAFTMILTRSIPSPVIAVILSAANILASPIFSSGPSGLFRPL